MKHDTFRESLVVVVTWRKRPFGSKLVGRNICSYGTMSMLEDDTWPNSKNNSIQPSWHQEFLNTNRVLWGRVDSVRLYYRTRDKGGLLTPLVHLYTVTSTCSEIAIAGPPAVFLMIALLGQLPHALRALLGYIKYPLPTLECIQSEIHPHLRLIQQH